MFIHETHLPQVLTPSDYTSAEQLERERELLFLPGWHCVAAFADFPNVGDYVTTDLLGHPIIIWRADDGYHTFLNVCPHRFSTLRGDACGHAGETLQCQYHGWEFDEGGHTRKIPDAQSFKPMSKGALCLTKYRTETCGQLIFVNLSADGPNLEEYLGPGYAIGAELCAPHRRLAATLDYEIATNWKNKCENSLESYHVDMVHPQTFGASPDAEICEHELEDNWTTFATHDESPSAWMRFLDRMAFRFARVEPDFEYKHYHYYPHIMFGKMRLFSWMEWTIPLSTDRTRVIGKFFVNGGESGGRRARILSKVLGKWERDFFKQLREEDCTVLEEVFRGLKANTQPSTGLVSIREERCFHFQEYIKRATMDEVPAEPELTVTAGS